MNSHSKLVFDFQWLILRWKHVTSEVPAKRFTSWLLFASVTDFGNSYFEN